MKIRYLAFLLFIGTLTAACGGLTVEPGDSGGDLATVLRQSKRPSNSNAKAPGPCNGIIGACKFEKNETEIRVTFGITSGMTEKLTSVLARADTSHIVENAYKFDPKAIVWVTGTFSVNDSGSVTERPVLRAVYSVETAEKVANGNIAAPQVWDEADDAWVHPDF
jgi:hypothetical protein